MAESGVKELETLTDSTDIVEINGDLLRKEFGITDEMLPEGVTVEKIAEDSSFTYRDLYEEGNFPKDFYISENDIETNDDQTLDIAKTVRLQQEGMIGTDHRYIFVDKTNRFLIIMIVPGYPDYNFLHDFINS